MISPRLSEERPLKLDLSQREPHFLCNTDRYGENHLELPNNDEHRTWRAAIKTPKRKQGAPLGRLAQTDGLKCHNKEVASDLAAVGTNRA